jgi:hypothetical protein
VNKFLVVSYESEQQQWFYDFVIAATDEEAQASVLAARPYVEAADATELTALRIMAANLEKTSAHRIEHEFATLEDDTDHRHTAVRS